MMLTASFFLFVLMAMCQTGFSVMSYNCENAFDTIHDESKNDYEFLPEGSRHWSRYRFFSKLKSIMKVIMSVDVDRPVDFIGLCEVENDTVLTYLTQRTALSRIGYDYVMTHSEDERGVDVAFLYSKYNFRMLGYESIRTYGLETPTRDILHVTGVVTNNDTLDFFVCHLPSKLGGKSADQKSRKVANSLRHSVDSICSIREIPYIVIMGDFNAEYKSSVISSVIGANSSRIDYHKLRNDELVDLVSHRKSGTYKYHGQWSIIDHIIVSGSLVNGMSNILTSNEMSGIYMVPYLLEDDVTYGGKKPFRTYIWTKYNGGISDHLPVWAKFQYLKK